VKVFQSPQSDLANSSFVESITNRLLLHHAITEEKFNKKSFEYALKSAFEACKIDAKIADSQTSQGADLVVNGFRLSLKTEAAQGINENKLTISKLMEARWIRECRTKNDFVKGVRNRVLPSLNQIDRILVMRAFDLPLDFIKYELVEIPINILKTMGDIEIGEFGKRTKNGGSSAIVNYLGAQAFRLVLDGSVEKVTVSRLEKSLCSVHCTWEIPVSRS
jgi:hypothetical protein